MVGPENDNKESSMRSCCKDLSSIVQESRKKEDASLCMISWYNVLIPRTSLPTPITGNTYNYFSIDTANFGFSQETRITPQVAKEIQKLRDMISSVLGVVKHIPKVPFSCNMTFERLTSDLYRITHGSDESLRSYVNKFGRESLDIPNLDITTAVQAFKMGLQRNSPFYDDLVMNPCRNMDEV
ncbi:hypothetical protein E3N88_14228 [Mikania micrantha]|uniref:Retrotransposon gag domain-containing protein n=1 Tax=Mikania micrantha TaxID=192012 RepID=A0A5N6P242_9ASTR|nr:hypothetical protein E3N88_14228 [Mikania micrantha]